MRDQSFEAVLHALERKINGLIEKSENPTRKHLAVCGLANALAEAIIILRAAYEAVIRGIYLEEFPEKLPAHEAFSAIAMLRNQLEMVKILNEFGDRYEDEEQQKKLIEQQKSRIILQGFHKLHKLSEEDLDKWESVKKLTNKSNLPRFEDIRKSIKKTPLVTALITTGFQVYNIGSQMAHSSFEMMTTMVYFDMKHPLYTEHVVYSQVFLLMLCACQCYAACGAISAENFNLLKKEYEQSSKELVLAGCMQL